MFALINVVGVEFLINFGGLGRSSTNWPSAMRSRRCTRRSLFVILVSVGFFLLTERVEQWLTRSR
jgi:hypothetical protein